MGIDINHLQRIPQVVLLGAILSSCGGHGIKPFTSDGCSAFPDGTLKQRELWLSCCTAHDIAYWKRGLLQRKASIRQRP